MTNATTDESKINSLEGGGGKTILSNTASSTSDDDDDDVDDDEMQIEHEDDSKSADAADANDDDGDDDDDDDDNDANSDGQQQPFQYQPHFGGKTVPTIGGKRLSLGCDNNDDDEDEDDDDDEEDAEHDDNVKDEEEGNDNDVNDNANSTQLYQHRQSYTGGKTIVTGGKQLLGGKGIQNLSQHDNEEEGNEGNTTGEDNVDDDINGNNDTTKGTSFKEKIVDKNTSSEIKIEEVEEKEEEDKDEDSNGVAFAMKEEIKMEEEETEGKYSNDATAMEEDVVEDTIGSVSFPPPLQMPVATKSLLPQQQILNGKAVVPSHPCAESKHPQQPPLKQEQIKVEVAESNTTNCVLPSVATVSSGGGGSGGGTEEQQTQLQAWKEVHVTLIHAVLVAREAIAAKKLQRRFWLETICGNLTRPPTPCQSPPLPQLPQPLISAMTKTTTTTTTATATEVDTKIKNKMTGGDATNAVDDDNENEERYEYQEPQTRLTPHSIWYKPDQRKRKRGKQKIKRKSPPPPSSVSSLFATTTSTSIIASASTTNKKRKDPPISSSSSSLEVVMKKKKKLINNDDNSNGNNSSKVVSTAAAGVAAGATKFSSGIVTKKVPTALTTTPITKKTKKIKKKKQQQRSDASSTTHGRPPQIMPRVPILSNPLTGKQQQEKEEQQTETHLPSSETVIATAAATTSSSGTKVEPAATNKRKTDLFSPPKLSVLENIDDTDEDDDDAAAIVAVKTDVDTNDNDEDDATIDDSDSDDVDKCVTGIRTKDLSTQDSYDLNDASSSASASSSDDEECDNDEDPTDSNPPSPDWDTPLSSSRSNHPYLSSKRGRSSLSGKKIRRTSTQGGLDSSGIYSTFNNGTEAAAAAAITTPKPTSETIRTKSTEEAAPIPAVASLSMMKDYSSTSKSNETTAGTVPGILKTAANATTSLTTPPSGYGFGGSESSSEEEIPF